jgi:hypothetical protein
MKAGDQIEAVTKKVGIKPCQGCKERKLLFNRRGWIGGTTAMLLIAKNTSLTHAWEAFGAEVAVDLGVARAFVGQFNTCSKALLARNDHHGTLPEVMARIVSHKQHFQPDDIFNLGYLWMSNLRPANKEVLPGWTIDYAIITDGYPRPAKWAEGKPDEYPDGYRLVLRGEHSTLVTDEDMIVYNVPTIDNPPAAKDLERASDYPGALQSIEGLARY